MATNRKAGAAWKETRHDKWYTLAKEQGYRSRAAFKLIQLNQKYNFLSSTKSVLDLGAAPGGWLQVCQKYMPVSSMILGVDLVPIKPMRGVTSIQADITTAECKTLIKKELQGWDVDLVLHDGAPNVAGGMVWSKDAYQQNELVIHSLRLATHFMRPNATFITKVFRSQDYNSLLWVLQQLFRSVDVTKPVASRNASAEIFIVCRQYLAPKHIDPFLLDPAHVFQQFDTKQPVDVFRKEGKKGPRSRQGYSDAEMAGLIGQSTDVMNFIEADEPIVTLGSYHAFTFQSEAAQALKRSASTTAEILALCEDLKVLGKGDFKSLLRWRKKMRDWIKELKAEEGRNDEGKEEEEKPKEEVKTEEEKAEEEEAAMTRAIAELKSRQLHRHKVEKRKKHERKQKATQRLLLNKNNLMGVEEMIGADPNDELFSLSTVSGGVMEDIEGGEERVEMEDEEEGEGEESEEEVDYVDRLEKELDGMYDQYKERRRIVEKIREKGEEEIRQAEAAEEEAGEQVEEEEEEESDEELYQQMKVGMKRKRQAEEEEEDEEAKGNPLVVSLEEQERISAIKKAERWFQRDVFGGGRKDEEDEENDEKEERERSTLMNLMTPTEVMSSSDDEEDDMDDEEEDGRWLGDDDEEEEEKEPLTRKQREAQRLANLPVKDRRLPGLASLGKTREQVEAEQKKKEKREKKNIREERRLARKAQLASPSITSDSNSMVDEEDDLHLLTDQDSAKKAKKMAKRSARLSGSVSAPNGDFEEVPQTAFSSDDDAVATTLALGTRMLQKKAREALLDSSYNRYAVDSEEQKRLPAWFQSEEAAHNTAQLPVTKEEVAAFKDRLKLINAKPIKKIAEARARKKVRTERRWEKIQKKMDEVSKEEGGSVGDKLRKMESLMKKKDKRSLRGDRKYFVTKKGGGIDEVKRKKGTKVGGLTVQVDKRLKKDKRGVKVASKKSKKRKSTANKRKRGA